MEIAIYIIEFVAVIGICVLVASRVERGRKRAAVNRQSPDAAVGENVSDTVDGGLDEGNKYSGMDTRRLCEAILADMNCTVEQDDDIEGRVAFVYQGETFHMDFSPNCLVVTVWDFAWGAVSLDNLDEVSGLRKIVNEVNIRQGATAFYTIDKEYNRMLVHSKRDFMIVPEIPGVAAYMRAMLAGFFNLQRALRLEFDELRKANAEKRQ